MGQEHALFLAPFERKEGKRPPEASSGSKSSSRRWARALKEAAAEDKGKLLSETRMARPLVSTLNILNNYIVIRTVRSICVLVIRRIAGQKTGAGVAASP